MTIMLTKEEMESFQAKLSNWFDKRSVYAFERLSIDVGMLTGRNVTRMFEELFTKFEAETPKPDWRSLL